MDRLDRNVDNNKGEFLRIIKKETKNLVQEEVKSVPVFVSHVLICLPFLR
jgi:hypothetical protein